MSGLGGQDEDFVRRAAAALGESADALDARTLSRLTRARHAALAAAEAAAARPAWLRGWHALWPAGAGVAAVLALLLVVGQPLPPAALQGASLRGEDFELLADRDALALAQDADAAGDDADYAFYDWAVDAARSPAGAGS